MPGNTTSWERIKAEHDARVRRDRGFVGYWLFRIRHGLWLAWHRPYTRLRWWWNYRVGDVVALTQRLCSHEHTQIVRVPNDDDSGHTYLSVCMFCTFVEVDDDSEIMDEAFRRADEARKEIADADAGQ